MDTLGLLGQAIECSICLDQLDISSRVLPCQHTFCTKCLLDIINSHKELRCPECRALVTVPFEALKPNIILMRILEGMKNIPHAPKNEASSSCSSMQTREEAMKLLNNSSNISASESVSKKAIVTGHNNLFSDFTNHSPAANTNDSMLINFSSHDYIGIPHYSVDENVNFPPASPSSICTNASLSGNYFSKDQSFVNLFPQTRTNNFSLVSTSSSVSQASFASAVFSSHTSENLPLKHAVCYELKQIGGSSNARDPVNIASSNQESFLDPNSCNEPVLINESQENISNFQSLPSFSNVSNPVSESSINFQSLVGPLNLQAKALYSYDKQEERDLSFKKGSVITICKQIDENWFYGELNKQFGFIPSSYVALVEPLPSHVPQCRALYDFKINVQEEKNCLTFNKGDMITVLRRIDDNWAEGKLNTYIGIFPLSFVRLNDAAKILLKISNNEPQGPSGCSISPLLPTSSCKKDTNSIVTTSPPVATKSTSSGSVLLPSLLPISLQSDELISTVRVGIDIKLDPQKKDFTSDFQLHTPSSSKSSLRSNRPLDSTNATENSKNLTKSNGIQETSSESSTQLTESSEKLASLQLYVALYSYRPRKADELELRKGYLYSVSDKCQDGWCKGRCLSTDKIGVFPGNYIQIAKAQTISAFLSRCSPNVLPSSPSRSTILGSTSLSSSLNRNCSVKNTSAASNPHPLSSIAAGTSCSSTDFQNHSNVPTLPPELPPRQININSMASINIADMQKLSLKEIGSSSSTSPCPSLVSPQHEKKVTTKDRANAISSISMIKKLTNSRKGEKKTSLVSVDNPVFEENINITYSPKASQLKIDETPDSNESPKSSKHPVPLFLERYRCLEPYPPNGNNELELKIGDVVYVHKKGQDGWYKGTMQRTGKTGLFPASFVEPC